MLKLILKMKKKLKESGFTLVELLAVIVILAIIMLIAIPAVLNTLQSARKKTFEEFVDKSVNQATKKLMESQLAGEQVSGCVVYNIKNNLDLSSVGDFNGYVLIDSKNEAYITLWNDELMVIGLNYSNEKIEDKLVNRKTDEETNNMLTSSYLCSLSSNCTKCNDLSTGETIDNENSMLPSAAYLKTGLEINAIFKSVAKGEDVEYSKTDELVTSIKYVNEINEAGRIISLDDSPNPVYTWFDNGILYVGSKSDKIFLNGNSILTFYGFTKMTSLDLSHFDFKNVKNLDSIFYYNQSLQR